MAEEEKQTLLPIFHRHDHIDPLADENYVVIDVNCKLNKLLESGVVDESKNLINPSINRIPNVMKDIQPKAFKPQLVSFGPYHHGDKDLAPMEQEKRKVFRMFVKDKGVDYTSIVCKVSGILKDLYGAYDKLDEKWKKEGAAEFMEMMIIDACFMLVFFLQDEGYGSLFTLKSDIQRDMLLLENQLPFELLKLLYDMLPSNDKEQDKEPSLISLINDNLLSVNKNEKVIEEKRHLLEIYRSSLVDDFPPKNFRQNDNDQNNKDQNDNNQNDKDQNKKDQYDDDEFRLKSQIIPQATLLRDAGITFERSSTKNLNDVSFDPKKGVLKLPCLMVDDDTETYLLNVMAFEKLNPDVGSTVTSFIVLMNNLIDIDKDVELLSTDNKIIANALGNNEEAANLFSVLGKGATLSGEDNITKVHRMVNEHCGESWNKWCASLKHNYFQNPWAIISLLAAVFAFAILIVQAIYQIVDFHVRK